MTDRKHNDEHDQCGQPYTHDAHLFGARGQWDCTGAPFIDPTDEHAQQEANEAAGAYADVELTPADQDAIADLLSDRF